MVQLVSRNLGFVAGNTQFKHGLFQKLVIEGCGFPFLCTMTLCTLVRGLTMDKVRRSLMTTYAFLSYWCIDQSMGKLLETAVFGHTQVIAVAGNTIIIQQLLMEWYLGFLIRLDSQ